MVWAAAPTSRAVTGLCATLLQGESATSGLDDAKTVADIVGTLITALAVIVGALWAYYRFVKGRTYRPRLEVSMGGEWFTVDGKRLLLARVRLKNIGASVVELLQKGTGLRVSTLGDSDSPRTVSWMQGRVYTILDEHAWIEPGETGRNALTYQSLRGVAREPKDGVRRTARRWSNRGSSGRSMPGPRSTSSTVGRR